MRPEQAPPAPPQLELLLEAFGDIHRPAIVPEFGIIALGHLVVKDDEIANELIFGNQQVVVLLDLNRVETGVGKQCEDPEYSLLDQVDAGRFKRFDEPARETDRD